MTDHTGVETPEPEDDDNEKGEERHTTFFTLNGQDITHMINPTPLHNRWPFGPQQTPKPDPEPEPAFDMDAPSEIMVGAKQIKDMTLEELIEEATHHQRHFFTLLSKERLMMVVANGRVSRYKERLCREMGSGFDVDFNTDG